MDFNYVVFAFIPFEGLHRESLNGMAQLENLVFFIS